MRPLLQLLFHPLLVTVYQWLRFGCPGLPEEILSCDDITPSFGGLFDKASEDTRLLPNLADGFHDVGRQLKHTAGHQEKGLSAIEILAALVYLLIPPSIWAAVAYCYKTQVNDRREPFLPADSIPQDWSMVQADFTKGVCQCFDDMQICLHGWCCWWIRISDTYAATGIQPYWIPFALLEGVYFAAQLLGFIILLASNGKLDLGMLFYFIFDIFVACWLAQQRGRLREKFGGTSQEFKLVDCVCYWCCGMCITCQEAAQVDGAMGVHVDCCCQYSNQFGVPAATVVGQAVATATPLKGEAVAPPAAAAQPPVVQPAENNAAATDEAALPKAEE